MIRTNRTLDRLNDMLERAINGEDIESSFNESKVSQIESKLHKYLVASGTNKKKLEEQKHQVEELISDISHQTKTPIANISLYSELLSECESQEAFIRYNTLLQSQTEKLNFLITSLVKLSRLENGIISVQPEKQSVSELLDYIEDSMPMVDVVAGDINVNYDLKWTGEAILNMIDNAIKYGSTDTKISVIAYELFVRIDIEDNGIGIAEEEIPKIFGRFYRSETVREKEGVGIGLYLAREIIAKQGGYIKVKSKVGTGSTFAVFLPRD